MYEKKKYEAKKNLEKEVQKEGGLEMRAEKEMDKENPFPQDKTYQDD